MQSVTLTILYWCNTYCNYGFPSLLGPDLYAGHAPCDNKKE